ncbi:MAG TPA: BTAD domain-containing putative transcriptional regulator [Actinomycetota bacterium]
MANASTQARVAVVDAHPRSESGRGLLQLLNGFELVLDGRRVHPSASGQRLIAFLALQGRWTARAFVAGSLWSNVPESRAAANLRSALWRLRESGVEVVAASAEGLRVDSGVLVDLDVTSRVARRILRDPSLVGAAEGARLCLPRELLPGWYDEWVTWPREQFRQLRLHALEALSAYLLARERFAGAIEAAQAAVRADPLRESANRLLVRAHLAEGNVSCAIDRFRRYRDVVRLELGIEPSPAVAEVIAEALGADAMP